ncbi:Aspartate carbamoyltransferase catalytic chain [Pirellulimonas nuda]|uniref:Aspartate carbamoyltransferase catalytic chain n=1 Tax=Pirellulimonas nuda TaxID=2528009 RepID=A0A518DAL6_9BACT|nr:aspartate carbamoyltransferase [Pirellulimonas nuda]QDU88466.1 Aspartate carbamoyltransferase catalytic chain [Pirellulimonas nuda]
MEPPAPLTQDDRDLLHYETRLTRPVAAKAAEFCADGRLRHVIFSGQLSPHLLDALAGTADRIRLLSQTRAGQDFLIGLAPHKRAMLYFTQPSTRTFLSFMAACQILGITCNEVRDPSTSSETKGETRFDSIRMFSSYFDLIIMRSPIARLAECCAYLMNDLEASGSRSVPIINAGSGADEHPTQALLDIYTLQRTFNFENPKDSPGAGKLEELRKQHGFEGLERGLAGKTYGFCGDICRGRTVRSLAMLLAAYPGVRLVFITPDHPRLRMRDDLRDRLRERGVAVVELDSFEAAIDGRPAIEQIDALYMTRVQKEHNEPGDAESLAAIDFSQYRLSMALVSRMKRYAPILHPFPRDQHFGEIPHEIDNDPRAMYFRQARNGMWIRAALLAHVLGLDVAAAPPGLGARI